MRLAFQYTRCIIKERCSILRKNKILITLLFCLIFPGHITYANDGLSLLIDNKSQVEIECIELSTTKDGLVLLKGDVVLKKGILTVSAQEAVYNSKAETAELSGGIRIETGEDTFTGESGNFNFIEQTGVINNAKVFIKENNFYIDSGKIEMLGEKSFLIRDFELTTCDSSVPEWSITGTELNVTIEGYGKIKNAAFRFKNVPLLYVPYLIFPAKTERQSGVLIPQAGYSGRNGVEFELPVFWAISDNADATFYERYMSDRGLMQGVELRYVSGRESKGSFNFDILSDRIEEKNMNNPDQLELSPFERKNSSRYWFRGRMDQQFPWNVKARMDADIVSDQDYLKEFESGLTGFNTRPDYEAEFGRPIEEFNSPLRTSTIRLDRDSENYSIQAVSSFYQRPEGFINDTTPQPVAGLYYSMLPRFIKKSSLMFRVDSDYDYISRDYGQKGHSFSISPEVSYPVWFGEYLQFEPGVSYSRNMQWLDNDMGNNIGSQSSDLFQGQARLSTLLERIFDVDSGRTKRLKHKIVPSLTYEYRSHKDEDRYQPWFESIDEEGSSNRLSFSIDNFLDAKNIDGKGNITYRQWGTFRITQGYDIDESRRDTNLSQKKEPFEPLTAELSFSPFLKIDMNAEVQWDHYKNDFSFADIALNLDVDRANGRTDIYRVDYVYNNNGNKGLSYYININLAKGFALGSTLQRDIDLRNDIEKSYWLEYSSQCWGLRMGVSQNDDESRVMFSFRLLGFAEE